MLTVGQGFIIFVFVGSLPFAIFYFIQQYLKHRKDYFKKNYIDVCIECENVFSSYGYEECDSDTNKVVWANKFKFYITYTFKNGKWHLSEFMRTNPQWDWVECPFYKGRSYKKLLKVLEQQDKLNKQHIIKKKLQQMNSDFT